MRSALIFTLALGFAPWVSPSGAEQSPQVQMTRARATQLAERYFESEIAFEGGLGEPTIRGQSWAFPVKLGYAGEVQPSPLLIDRATGKASWADVEAFRKQYGRTRQGVRQ
jgi:hypothetical protein